MSIIKASIQISNPRKPDLKSMEVSALADSGALQLCISEHIAMQLELEELYQREVTTADVGPIEVKFENNYVQPNRS